MSSQVPSVARTRFVDLTERIIYLRSIPVAALLPPPVLRVIASYLRECSFPAGALLMRQDEPIDALHLLTEGKLQLVRNGKPFGNLAPPQSLGFLGILSRTDGTYDATAEEDTRSLELKADALMELLEDHVELLHATIRYLAERDLYEVQELPPDAQEKRLISADAELPDRPLTYIERLLYLRGLSAFRRANLNVLSELARQLVERRYAPGERIWQNGDPGEDQLYLMSGRARCIVSEDRQWGASGKAVLGGLEAIAEKPRWYTLEAETPLVLLRGSINTLLDVTEDDFGMAIELISMLARDLVGLLERRALLGQSSVGVMRNVSKLGAVKVGA